MKNLHALLLTASLLWFADSGIAQAKPQTTTSQGNEITISISGIEYDDADFAAFKENLKANQHVKNVKSSYAQGTARISCTYNGSADELWDEVPVKIKQAFKVTAVDKNTINLASKNVAGSNAPATNANSASNQIDTAGCNCCVYFPLCKYDETRSFQGVVYKGLTFDNGMFYYYCSNGTVIQKQVTLSGSTITSVYTQTILKCDAAVGTTWTETDVNGANNQHTLMAKGITLQLNGKTYTDVMQVYHKIYTAAGVSLSKSNYYAKGIGLIKDSDADLNYDPAQAFAQKKSGDSILATLPGTIDQSIVGTWAYYDSVMNWKLYYKFNSDGTWEYYAGSVSPANAMYSFGKNYWHVNGDNLELWYGGSLSKHLSWAMQKKNDAKTGKPTLIIQFKGPETRTYFSQDGKPAW